MKIIKLQISKVVSQTSEMEPVYEQYPIKLDERAFYEFIPKVRVMGYIASRTKVISAIEVIGIEKSEIDHSVYENALRAAFNANVVEEKVDYKSEFEKQKKMNEDLLSRLEALEKAPAKTQNVYGKPQSDTDDDNDAPDTDTPATDAPATDEEKAYRKTLWAAAKAKGFSPARNITTEDLKALVENN